MTARPVRRIAAAWGLIALAPTGAMLAAGTLSPRDAAVRALATLAMSMLAARVVSTVLCAIARQPARERAVASRVEDGRADVRAAAAEPAAGRQSSAASSAASTTAGSN